jgi:hypothetical protein
MRTMLLMILVLLVAWLPAPAQAEQDANATLAAPKIDLPDNPEPPKQERGKIPVTVELRGDDNVGGRLAYHLKELFEKSGLFDLSAKDERKIKVMLRTVEEFPGRPNMSSAYAVVFVYSETEGTLKYLLAHDVGFVHTSSVKEDAETLVGKTHEVYSRYSYLFE